MSRHGLTVLVLVLAGGLVGGCGRRESGAKTGPTLLVYCAAGVRLPIEELAAEFEQVHPGAKVKLDSAGSGELLGRIHTARAREFRPQVYVAADDFYALKAREQGQVDRIETMAWFVPVIAVQAGNPKAITALKDLGRSDVTVALGNPDAAAVGLASDRLLAKAGLTGVRQKAVAYPTVQALASAVKLKAADATIIWDATVRQGDFATALQAIEIPGAEPTAITICRVTNAKGPALADEFIDLTISGPAKPVFARHGFTVNRPAGAATSQPVEEKEPPSR